MLCIYKRHNVVYFYSKRLLLNYKNRVYFIYEDGVYVKEVYYWTINLQAILSMLMWESCKMTAWQRSHFLKKWNKWPHRPYSTWCYNCILNDWNVMLNTVFFYFIFDRQCGMFHYFCRKDTFNIHCTDAGYMYIKLLVSYDRALNDYTS